MTVAQQTLCRHFADLLSYPDGATRQTAAACAALLRELHPEAAEALTGFVNFLDAHQPARVEEIFTATFDLQPACHPYVGYQLCGESQQRTMFLIKLQQLLQGGEQPVADQLLATVAIGNRADEAQHGAQMVRQFGPGRETVLVV